jgi:hypothetical protein
MLPTVYSSIADLMSKGFHGDMSYGYNAGANTTALSGIKIHPLILKNPLNVI